MGYGKSPRILLLGCRLERTPAHAEYPLIGDKGIAPAVTAHVLAHLQSRIVARLRLRRIRDRKFTDPVLAQHVPAVAGRPAAGSPKLQEPRLDIDERLSPPTGEMFG